MDHWTTRWKQSNGADGEPVDAMDNDMKIKVEPEDGDLITSCIDIEEHPVKLEDEEDQTDTLICGLPTPDTEFSDQEQSHETDHKCDDIEAEGTPSIYNILKFKSEHCFELLFSKRRLSDHIRAVHGQRKHSCDVCGKCFPRKFDLKRHLLTHSSKPQFECTKCDKKYRSDKGLRQHTEYFHLGIKHECDLCGKMYTSKCSLSMHKNLVHDIDEIESFQCDFCKKIIQKRQYFINHLRNFHLDFGKYSCNICHKPMKNKDTMVHHKWFKHRINDEGHKCDDIEAASQPSLDKVLKFKCEHCCKLFVSKGRLSNHTRSVHGEKKHPCDVCGKRFACNANLQRHLFTHKPQFECTKCGQKYCTAMALRQHTKIIHLGIKHECHLCDKMYTTKPGLSKHKKIVHNIGKIKSFECDFCKKIFKMKERCIKHIKNIHLDFRKFPMQHKPSKKAMLKHI